MIPFEDIGTPAGMGARFRSVRASSRGRRKLMQQRMQNLASAYRQAPGRPRHGGG